MTFSAPRIFLHSLSVDPARLSVLNVIRMIKMFGWEKKIESQVGRKRDEELHFMQKKRLWALAIDDLK